MLFYKLCCHQSVCDSLVQCGTCFLEVSIVKSCEWQPLRSKPCCANFVCLHLQYQLEPNPAIKRAARPNTGPWLLKRIVTSLHWLDHLSLCCMQPYGECSHFSKSASILLVISSHMLTSNNMKWWISPLFPLLVVMVSWLTLLEGYTVVRKMSHYLCS